MNGRGHAHLAPEGCASKDAGTLHHNGSFRKYMENKNNKLNEQFGARAAAEGRSDLFHGVAIYVNGFTHPSHAELKHLMAQHGGTFQNYYSRATVTHIICANLPDAKVKQYEKERSPTPVVRPEWVVESIAAETLLPIKNYVLWQLRDAPGQRTLMPFDRTAAGPPLVVHDPALGRKHTKPMNEYDPKELAAAQEVAARMRAECDVLKGPPRSSKDDPNFVESYYRASRLHFIGRWKSRLEALMASAEASNAPAPAPYVLGGTRSLIHLDMDCFFASVAVAGRPELRGKPLAVCHSNSARGSGEVSSANYEARRYGVTASMFIQKAKELCPSLVVVPYEFDKYEAASEQVYRILLRYTAMVQPLSCDEAFLDVTGLGDPQELASRIRADVEGATGCAASAGLGPNMLLARIATKYAKPNGQFAISGEAAGPFLAQLKVTDLPGVGWSTEQRLKEMGIITVEDVRKRCTKEKLQKELGAKAGALLWDFSRGEDARRVEQPQGRKSVGAEVNWGVRFEKEEDPLTFLTSLAEEVERRLRQAGMKGRTITLKVKRKKEGWTEPIKFLGCGACDSLSRSVTLARCTASAGDIANESHALYRALRVPFDQVRGMGVTLTRLDTDTAAASTRAHASATAAKSQAALPVRSPLPRAPQTDLEKSPMAEKLAVDSESGWDSKSDGTPPARRSQSIKRKPQAKQVTLADVLPSPGPKDGGVRTHNLTKYEGMSLTQIDAKELASLPWQVQRELVLRLPRTRSDQDGIEPQAQETPATHSESPCGDVPVPPMRDHIEPLPSFSQVDVSVMHALPLAVRKELETAYDLSGSHRRGDGGKPGKASRLVRRGVRATGKMHRIDAYVVNKKTGKASTLIGMDQHPGMNDGTGHSAEAVTFSQIDPEVLHELPKEIQDEIFVALRPLPRARAAALKRARWVDGGNDAKRHRTRLDAEQAEQIRGSLSDDETVPQELLDRFPPTVRRLVGNEQLDKDAFAEELPAALGAAFESIDKEREPDVLHRVLEAMKSAIVAMGKKVVGSDLEGTRRLLRHVRRLGLEYAAFREYAEAAVSDTQRRVRRRYGWPVALGPVSSATEAANQSIHAPKNTT